MAKPKKEDVFKQAKEHIGEFYSAENIRRWLRYEVRENYSMVAGDAAGLGQWPSDDLSVFTKMQMPIVTVNKIAPVIDAIAGFEIQNPVKVDYIARMATERAAGFTDMMDKAAKYFESDSKSRDIDSDAFRDVLHCGVGSCDFNLGYVRPPQDGNVEQERIFPGFCGWDVAACGQNLGDADHVWRAKIVRASTAKREIQKKRGKNYEYNSGGGIALTGFTEMFNLYQMLNVELDVVYQYQWRELEPFYRVKSPFSSFAKPTEMMTGEDNVMMDYAHAAEERYGFKLDDLTFNLEKDTYREFAKDMDTLGIPLEKAELEKYRYWRAVIVGSEVMELEENISQKGFTQKFMTGKYSENERIFYGAVRGMKEPQRSLNRNLSRYEKFLSKAALGGDYLEQTAVEDLRGFLDTKAKAESSGTVVVADGTVSGGRIKPRDQVQFPPGLMEIIPIMENSVMGAPGINPALMGVSESSDESGLMFSRKVKQGMAVLAWALVKARHGYYKEKGELYVDFARDMAQNKPGRFIRDIAGEENAPHLRLFEDNIAEEYDIIIDIAPSSPDEKYEFSKLILQLAGSQPALVGLAPLALDGLPYEKKDIDAAKQALVPPPPPPPDPDNQALIRSETQFKIAKAKEGTASANLKEAQTLTELKEAQAGKPNEPPVDMAAMMDHKAKDADRKLKEREVDLNEARTAAEIAEKDKRLKLDRRKVDIDALKLNLEERKLAMTGSNEREKIDVSREAAKNKAKPGGKKKVAA